MKSSASFRWLLAGGVLLVGGARVEAQSAPATSEAVPAPAPAFSAPTGVGVQAVGPNFKLQAGDVLAVQVANHPEMSAASVAVAANGKLNLPIVGALTAQGKTLGAVTAQIARAYSTQLNRPQVSVTLVSSIPRQLTVRGAVAKPGPLDVRSDLRLSEVITNAGGLFAEGLPLAGDEVQATLARGKMAPRALDLDAALSQPQSPANLALKAGDIINISARPQVRVSLAGDGVTPSVVKLRLSKSKPQVRVSDVLKAGGQLRGKTEQTRGFLLRAGKKTDLDVPALFNGSDPSADLVMRSGDSLNFETIEVKKIEVTVASLDHSVVTPGNYSFDNEASALRALVQAGGFPPDIRADQVAVSVQRGGHIIPVDVERAALNPQLDVPLENRDVVFTAFNPAPRVQLLGSVVKPNTYRLKPNATLLDSISTAGGLTLPPAQTSIRVLRTQPNGKQLGIAVDAARLFSLTDLSQNVRLQDGDSVFLGEARRGSQVWIVGEVTTPGSVELGAGDGLAELLLKAGGPKSGAALSKLSITSRGGMQRLVDASVLAQGGKVDAALEEGDYVNVPRNEASVTIWGAVTQQGNYTIPENRVLTLGNALLLAGGPVSNAQLKDVAVVHRLPNNATQIETVVLADVRRGVMNTDYALRPGDVVWVEPGRVTKSGLTKLSGLLGVVGLGLRVGGGF